MFSGHHSITSSSSYHHRDVLWLSQHQIILIIIITSSHHHQDALWLSQHHLLRLARHGHGRALGQALGGEAVDGQGQGGAPAAPADGDTVLKISLVVFIFTRNHSVFAEVGCAADSQHFPVSVFSVSRKYKVINFYP